MQNQNDEPEFAIMRAGLKKARLIKKRICSDGKLFRIVKNFKRYFNPLFTVKIKQL